MLLTDLLGPVRTRGTTLPLEGVDVVDLAYDSRRVVPGALFCCVPGLATDGHDHAVDAAARGAVALLVERPVAVELPQAVVGSVRAAMGPIADRLFGAPSAELAVLAVTGTNGKTTTAYLQHAILTAAGLPAGLLGTVERRIGGVAEPAGRTTQEAIDLHRDLRRMVEAGDRACAMEVSSHALDQDRVGGVRFAAAAFTNLTRDHLDYHPDMEAYFAAKARLFDGRCPRAANADDAYGRRLEAEVRFALDEPSAEVRAEDVRLGPDGSELRLRSPWGDADVRLRLVGRFNVENALAAAATAGLAGIGLDAIRTGLASLSGVPGRMQVVGTRPAVIVDYAHTPDALATVLATVRPLATGRVICVFGCGGDRDRGKRPEMARAACAGADRVLVTSDNPRSEDPDAIIADVMAGAAPNAAIEADRATAIRRAIAEAGPDDVVVVAGKGHEQGQEAGGVVTPFDDAAVAREALA
ncbi:MAG: UDP-N-acetylmuramoyl-L-alanyl-D-glutamate--2,6-diaminopimelate ligase [Gaiellales bacterium]